MENSIIERYKQFPEWLRWVLFFPISFAASIAMSFLVFIGGRYFIGDTIINILHSIAFQYFFLCFIFFTVPRFKFKILLGLIVLRSIILFMLVIQPILNLIGANFPLDFEFFKGTIGEILVLISSISLFGLLRKDYLK